MVKITKIDIKNFRAFRGVYQIDLAKAGKNLLIYGENGSGKSSLYLALKWFLESSEDDSIKFENYQNTFTMGDTGYIKLYLRAAPGSSEHVYEWSLDVKETAEPPIINAAKSKGFLDYKALLHTHYLHYENDTVNVFDLLIENLLANVINDTTGQSLAEEWQNISEGLLWPLDPTRHIETLEGQLEVFNTGLANQLTELQTLASEILHKFGYKVTLNLNFHGVRYNRQDRTLDNQEILLTVKFFDEDIPAHHRFLNEAKLSAIALAIYFAGFLLQPESDLKILALDDVLIGLDMSNRIPVLDILNEYFSDYQIFLTTYDRAWYEVIKQHTSRSGKWKYAEFYFSQTDEYEVPIYVEDKAYLEKAREYIDSNDYKACAIYVRTAFEAAIKQYCEKKDLAIKCRENPRDLRSEDFWGPIKTEKDEAGTLLLDLRIVDKIERARKFILNELSHATFANIYRKELEDAIDAVEQLANALA